MSATAYVLEVVRENLVAAVGGLVLVLLLPKLLSLTLQQWRLYSAFKHVPCDPDQHFLLGHGPK